MLELIVVVDEVQISFKGNKLSAYFYESEIPYLMINEVTEEPTKLAGFMKWDYWYLVEE